MFIKEYTKHLLLLLLIIIVLLFLMFIAFWELDKPETITVLILFLMFFRKFYQTITVAVFSNIVFIFSKKEIKIHHKDGSYMIVNSIKNPPTYKPYFYMNKGIDWFFNKIIQVGGGRKYYPYRYEVHNYDFDIILKRNLTKDDAEKELKKIIRIKKIKNLI